MKKLFESGRFYLILAGILYILFGTMNFLHFLGLPRIHFFEGMTAITERTFDGNLMLIVGVFYACYQVVVGTTGIIFSGKQKGTMLLLMALPDMVFVFLAMCLSAIASITIPWNFLLPFVIPIVFFIGAFKNGVDEKVSRILTKAVCYAFLIVLFIVAIVPVYMLLINSTRDSWQIQGGVSLIPGSSFRDNWQTLADLGIDVWLGIRNSSFVAFSSTFLTVYFSMLTAYAVVIYNFRFKSVFFVIILGMIMVPGQLYLTGFYRYMHSLNLLDNFIPLIIPSIAAPGAVFFFKQYLDASISHELVQAARIDGASEWGIFNKIVLPLAAPGLFTMGIFSFVGAWNAFMGPLFLIGGDQDLHTLPLIMQRLQGDTFRRDFGAIYFGMAFTLIPILIVYAAFSKFIITGISLGAVKE
jgi:multiple sugar transport system permease protein